MTNPVICLMGPTASGKTDLACALLSYLPFEIVSVDSAMIYRGMNIGTAKPDAQTLKCAPHHLIDILDPDASYSVANFCLDVTRLCHAIQSRGNIPLLVGGTMMYFRALQQGLSILPEANIQVRQQLLEQAQLHGWAYMYNQLADIDPVAAARIHAHDTQRIQRALEVYAVTGRSLSSYLHDDIMKPAESFVNICLLPLDRAWLHARINQRFEQMLAHGFIDEVTGLAKQWKLTPEHPALRCVGYRQVHEYLQGEYDYDTLRAKGAAATRQLAKRQLTWLRHWPEGNIFEAECPDVGAILSLIHRNKKEKTHV